MYAEIKPNEFEKNPFKIIGSDWMLITAGNKEKINTMTASWGGLGFMWGKNVAFVVVRPQRYTKEFIDASDVFSLTFFDDKYKKNLGYLGKVSGRDEDKIKNSNLTEAFIDNTPFFSEAHTVILCKKLFSQSFLPENFIDKSIIDKWYPNSDFHTMYIAQIEKILTK